MQQAAGELEERDVQIVVITFESSAHGDAYLREMSLPWPILIDEGRRLYAAYQMGSGRWRNLLGPAAWWIYAKLLFRGRRLRPVKGDVRQLGGDVLIDPQGVVRLHHVGRGPADRPAVARLLNVIDGRL